MSDVGGGPPRLRLVALLPRCLEGKNISNLTLGAEAVGPAIASAR